LWLGGRVLELTGDPVDLCAALVDVPSVSGAEAELADLVEDAFRAQAPHLEVLRSGAAVVDRLPRRARRRPSISPAIGCRSSPKTGSSGW